jgi:hypothetical protein
MKTRQRVVSKKDALRELWKRGILGYKRHEGQLIINDVISKDKRDIITVLAARRFGKSFELILQAVELCQSKPNAIVKYICPRLKMVKTIIKPNMRKILADCPQDLLPEWKENDKMYVFPNGSEIHLAGTDNGSHESIRGGHADLCIVDEAGFCDHLKYVVYDILAPTTDTTGGRVILASTPSKISSHDFIQHFVLPSQTNDQLIKFTINENPMLTDEKKASIMARFPTGDKDPGYRREYLCEIIRDKNAVVLPEFTHEKEKEIITAWKRPPYYDTYTSGDVGFRDLTVYLFAYCDFMNATLVIEDELVMNGPEMTTKKLAEQIKIKEKENFHDTSKEALPTYMRVMDNNLVMINDLTRLHNLHFLATAKDNKEAQINQVKIMINSNQIRINPKCKHLIYHMRNVVWKEGNGKNREFANIPDTLDHKIRGGHADAVDALIYLVRNIVRTHNPYPKDWGKAMGDNIFKSQIPNKIDEGLLSTIKKIMNMNN